MEFQTRSHRTNIQFHETLGQALSVAKEDSDVWKISFTLPRGEQVRLIRTEVGWVLENVFGERHI